MKEHAALKAIEQAEKLAERGRHEVGQHPASTEQVVGQMGALVDRVMGEAGLYAPEHAAIAIKQAQGDSAEASIILRAYRQSLPKRYARVSDMLKAQGLVKPVNEDEGRAVSNVNTQPIRYPALRSAALQTLARSETGGMMALGYSAMRGQGGDHPTIGELRVGWVRLSILDPRGRARCLGRIRVTESANISKIKTRKKDPVPYMSLGYGLCFGQNETKAICMGILDRSMRIPGDSAPAISQEFVLHHLEGLDSHGYLQSLKIPEYVAMQSELHDLRAAMRRRRETLESQAQPSRTEERDLV